MNYKIYYLILITILVTLYTVSTRSMQKKLDKIEDSINKKEILYKNFIDSLNNKYKKTLEEYEGILDSLPLGPPLDTLFLQDDYGVRKHPISGRWRMHSGVDLVDTWRDTVYVTGSGVIKSSGWNSGYGRCITVTHIGGYESRYAHLSKSFVRVGDKVHKGQPIGQCGSSGYVTGQHLHYEIRRNNISTDPMVYITQSY